MLKSQRQLTKHRLRCILVTISALCSTSNVVLLTAYCKTIMLGYQVLSNIQEGSQKPEVPNIDVVPNPKWRYQSSSYGVFYRISRWWTRTGSSINLASFRLRNDQYCVEWGVKLYSHTPVITT